MTRTVVMSENSSTDMLRIVTYIAFGWEYCRGYASVDGTGHPPMGSDTPLREILVSETYVFNAPREDTVTALSLLVLDPYGITDGDSL